MRNTFLMWIFMLFMVALYGASHGFIYYSLTQFFTSLGRHKLVVICTLSILGLSFLIASLAAHLFNNALTRGYYYLSGAWIGLIVNLLFAFLGAWLLVWIFQIAGLRLNLLYIGSLAVVLASVISVYGLWNAKHPVVKEISVSIDNLPEQWRGKKIVQLSDLHVGFLYREDSLAWINQKVSEINPDIVFITGDLFDGSDGDLNWVAQSLKGIKAKEGVFFITGNHETYLGLDKALAVVSQTNIEVLRDKMININGLQIIGVDYQAPGEQKRNLLEVFQKVGYDAAKPSILLYHAPMQIDEASSAGIDLMLSGHTHRGQIWPFGYITKLIFSGYDFGLKMKDKMYVYTSNGFGTWGPAMRTGNTPEIVEITLQ
jgi:predicted MPP superfamily phosphohydrolase